VNSLDHLKSDRNLLSYQDFNLGARKQMMSKISKREYLIEVKKKYWKADKKKKTQLLDDFCCFTKYNRKYALELLNKPLPRKWKRYRKRVKYYNQPVVNALKVIWEASNNICGERLHTYIPDMMSKLIDCNELHISDEVKGKLLEISLATVKRIIRSDKTRSLIRIGGTTRPGTLLKHEIAIRYGPWEEVDPGFFEMDTVANCGNTVAGEFIYNLNLIDIATGWSEQAAIWGKGERATLEQFKNIEGRLPFPVKGIDPDNGSEFINWHMHRHCQKKNINFTRSRPYHKNDNAHVEQKNWTAIRQLVGYDRLDKPEQLKILNDLYAHEWRLYLNFFQPMMKITGRVKNTKTGKSRKEYDKAKTPYQRVLEHPKISQETKVMLKQVYKDLNPLKLRTQIKAKIGTLKRTLKSDN
jgi:hypothetical protein